MILKIVFTALLLGAIYEKDYLKKKLESLLVVSLEKAVSWYLHLCVSNSKRDLAV